MKKAASLVGITFALCLMGGEAQAGRGGGSGTACLDVQLTATCSGNVVTATGTLTNCGTASDSVKLSETVTNAAGEVLSTGSTSATLKAGKTVSYPLMFSIPADTASDTYTLKVDAAASKGTGADSASVSLTVPCP